MAKKITEEQVDLVLENLVYDEDVNFIATKGKLVLKGIMASGKEEIRKLTKEDLRKDIIFLSNQINSIQIQVNKLNSDINLGTKVLLDRFNSMQDE